MLIVGCGETAAVQRDLGLAIDIDQDGTNVVPRWRSPLWSPSVLLRSRRSRQACLVGVRLLDDASWRKSWAAKLADLTLGSDGLRPFRDNLDYAAREA